MFDFSWKAAAQLLLVLSLSAVLSACGGEESEPAATPAPDTPAQAATTIPAAVTAPADSESTQPDSPLAAVESPLAAPESPLNLPPPGIGSPLRDFNTITQLAARHKGSAPAPGMASISGLLYSYSIQEVIPGTPFYLTPALKDGDRLIPPTLYSGPKADNGDVASLSDPYGRFAIDEVPPGTYYLSVFAPYDWILAFESQEARMPLQIQLEAGDQLDLGLLWLSWPNGG